MEPVYIPSSGGTLMWLLASVQEPINAVFDKAVFGNKVVMADILEADQSGNLPSSKPFTHKGGSAISNLMKQPKLVGLCLPSCLWCSLTALLHLFSAKHWQGTAHSKPMSTTSGSNMLPSTIG